MHQKLLVAVFGILIFASSANAQDSLGWQPSVDVIFTLTQNAYSDNWAGGDAGSVTWVGKANLELQRRFEAPWDWRNMLKLAYGQTHNQDKESKDWKRPLKSTDLIDFESLLRYMKWEMAIQPYAAFRLITQFEDASIENYTQNFNPIDLTESVGAAKTLYKKDDDEFIGRFGFGLRQRIMRMPNTQDSSKTDTESTNEGGLEFVLDGKYKIPNSSIQWTTKLTTFKAFFYSKSDELKGLENEDYWKAVDVNWENDFSAQVAKFLAVSLYVQWLYDKEIDKGGRFKQTLALNFTWKLL